MACDRTPATAARQHEQQQQAAGSTSAATAWRVHTGTVAGSCLWPDWLLCRAVLCCVVLCVVLCRVLSGLFCSIAPHAVLTLVFLDALPKMQKAVGL